MTSSRAGQGESWVTEHKMRGLRGTFTINLTICAQSRNLNWRPYHHFDLHAGCGWNRKYDVPGSPLAFLDAAEESGHPRVIAHFVEIDAARAAELEARPEIAARRNCFVHAGDNGVLCRRIPDLIRQHGDRPDTAVGTILIDPNGPTAVPYGIIAEVLRQCPRLDVIYNFPGTGTKRMPDGHRQKIVIEDIPDLFRKKFWLIRKQIGAQQWSLLIGRNFRCNDYPGLGFYHWESARGQGVVKTLATVARKNANQLEMF
jgi:three-Cys-motif partner protein